MRGASAREEWTMKQLPGRLIGGAAGRLGKRAVLGLVTTTALFAMLLTSGKAEAADPGIKVETVNSHISGLNIGQHIDLPVSCGAGYGVLSGGYYISSRYFHVSRSYPDGG